MSGEHQDELRIEGLELLCVVGVNDWERLVKQPVEINLKLRLGTAEAAASDDLADSVNYRSLTKRIVQFVEGSSFKLIETLAQGVADICLEEPRLSAVEVELRKPGALRHARSVGVVIKRRRNG